MKINLFEEIRERSRFGRSKYISKHNLKNSIFGNENPLSSGTNEFRVNESQKIWGVVLISIISFLTFLLFVSQSFKLQIVEGEDNLTLADGNRIRVVDVRAERGLISDKNGEVLVRNKPAFSLIMSTDVCFFSSLGGVEKCLTDLSLFLDNLDLDVNIIDIKNDVLSGKANVVIATDLSKDEIIPIETRLIKYPNFSIDVTPQREYVFGPSFSHLLGYVGFAETRAPVIVGKEGVEFQYNSQISGIDGGEVVQVDSLGRRINVLLTKNSIPGRSITLYVDYGLQNLAFELLKEKVENSDATAGVVVAQDPKNGGVLALVSYPTYDPNPLSKGISSHEFNELKNDSGFPFFNRAIAASYPPASTFKMIMASAALMEKVIGEFQEIFDIGFIQIGSFIYRNWKLDGHGLVNMRRAIQVSNDTYFYTVGGGYGSVEGLGIEKISDWARKFGFGVRSGIDLPGEVQGFMPNGKNREWYLGDTYITSIGQGDVLATPLQLNNVTTYFANDGFLFVPKVVKSIDGVEQDTEIISQYVIDEHTHEVVREGLKLAVESGGTGYPLFDFSQRHPGIELGGKTGTAEFGGPNSEVTHAWFTVFGPFEDAEIALTVFLEGGGSGASEAAPIAKELLDYWFRDR